MVLKYDIIGALLDPNNLVRCECPCVDIQGGGVPTEMDPNRRIPEQVGQDHGQKMLAGVLLHMVKAAGPVDLSGYWARGQGGRQNVGDALALVDHVSHVDSCQTAGIERLTS